MFQAESTAGAKARGRSVPNVLRQRRRVSVTKRWGKEVGAEVKSYRALFFLPSVLLTFYLPPPKSLAVPSSFAPALPHPRHEKASFREDFWSSVNEYCLTRFWGHYSTSQGPIFTEIIPEVCLCWISPDPRVQ